MLKGDIDCIPRKISNAEVQRKTSHQYYEFHLFGYIFDMKKMYVCVHLSKKNNKITM